MIRKILTTYTTLLEEYLSHFHNCPDGLAMMGQIGNGTEEKPNSLQRSIMPDEKAVIVAC